MIQAASLFNQLLQHFPRAEFAALVRKHDAERGAKGFTCWAQLVAMLFCQMAHADSLREICNGLACSLGKLVHLGIGVVDLLVAHSGSLRSFSRRKSVSLKMPGCRAVEIPTPARNIVQVG
jgi:hypothetical protein